MAVQLPIEERVKIRLGDFYYIADQKKRDEVRRQIEAEDKQKKN